MKIDVVHDIQHAYRRIVSAHSFPGTVVDLSHEASLIDIETDFPRPLILLAMMLLDAEVTFFLESAGAQSDAAMISQLTYSRMSPVTEAGYLFLSRSGSARISELVGSARNGSLESPHLGATIALEVSDLASGSAGLVLHGPGIAESTTLSVPETDWIEARADQNAEYPLGIDMLLVTPDGKMVALPRTTQIEEP